MTSLAPMIQDLRSPERPSGKQLSGNLSWKQGRGLLVVELRTHVFKPCPVYQAGLSVNRADQAFFPEFLEDGQRTVGQEKSFACVTSGSTNLAGTVTYRNDTATFGEDVESPLFKF